MQCDKCGKESVVYQEYSGQHLCRHHFDADLERRAKHEIRLHHWLVPGDHIAVALSGDANSSALLFFLKKLTSRRHDIRISAITVDEGIPGYRNPEIAAGIARTLDTDCIRVSFLERFGTLEDLAHRKGTAPVCSYCRVMRDLLLDTTAVEHGITKLASGDDLDDVSASVLGNILRGRPDMVIHSGAGKGKIPRIRPFIAIPKKEVALYADFHAGGYDRARCPYDTSPFDGDVCGMLADFTSRHPATRHALMNLQKNLTGSCTHAEDSCDRCGAPSDGICTNCRIIDEVTAHGS